MSFRPLKYIKNFQYFYEGNKNQKTSVCVIHLKLLQNRISSVFSRNSSSMSVVIKAFNYFTINIRRLRFRPQIFRNLIEKKTARVEGLFQSQIGVSRGKFFAQAAALRVNHRSELRTYRSIEIFQNT